MSKPLDYSKWDKIEVSDDDDEIPPPEDEQEAEEEYHHANGDVGSSRNIADDDDDDEIDDETREVLMARLRESGTELMPREVSVKTLEQPKSVTLGPSGWEVSKPPGCKEATASPFGSGNRQKKALPISDLPPPRLVQSAVDTGSAPRVDKSSTVAQQQQKKQVGPTVAQRRSRTFNGRFIHFNSSQHRFGYCWSQTKTTVRLSLPIGAFTPSTTLASSAEPTDDASSQKRRWMKNCCKVTSVEYPSTTELLIRVSHHSREGDQRRMCEPAIESSLRVSLAFPVETYHEDLREANWEVETVALGGKTSLSPDEPWPGHEEEGERFLKYLDITLTKQGISQGVYHWWDHCLTSDRNPEDYFDITTLIDECDDVTTGATARRRQEQASKAKEAWEEGTRLFEEQRKKDLAERAAREQKEDAA